MEDARRTSARALFVSPDGRLRAFWRLALFAVACLVLAGPVLAVVALLVERGIVGREVGYSVGLCSVLLLAHWVLLTLVDRRGWDTVGLDRGAARPGTIAWSAALGGAAIALPVLGLLAVGWMRAEPAEPGSSLAQAGQALLLLAPAAFVEELLMRGYVFATLREGIGLAGALLLTSVAFGLLHLANPGATAVSILMVMLAGVLLGMVFVVTRSLYAATAAHLAWNFVLAGVLHVAVSGLEFTTPDYRLVEAGPDWMTGGTWGPEGGVAAGLGMTAALAYLIVRPWRRRES